MVYEKRVKVCVMCAKIMRVLKQRAKTKRIKRKEDIVLEGVYIYNKKEEK